MPAAQRIELGLELGDVGHRHVVRLENPPPGFPAACSGRSKAAVDRLAHDGGDGYASLTSQGSDPVMAIVIDEDLEATVQ